MIVVGHGRHILRPSMHPVYASVWSPSETEAQDFIDDALVLLGLLSLISAIGVLYHYCDTMFRLEPINIDPTARFLLPEVLQLIHANKWLDVFLALV
jgi:hypothetical protein